MKTMRPTLAFLLSCITALFLLQFWRQPQYPLMLYAFLLGLLTVSCVMGLIQKRSLPWILTASMFGLIVALALAQRAYHVTTPTDIESFADGNYHELHGWIIDDPDIRPTETRLIVTVDRLDGATPMIGRVLVTEQGGYPPHRYGDEVTISGKLRRPEVIEGFDYPHYLELSGIRAVMTRGSVKTTESATKRPPDARTYRVFGLLYDLRKSVEDRIGLILPEPHASLLAGLLTGSRRGLPKHLSDDFRASGITHIIAVSGYNITIILTLLGNALFWLPAKRRFWPLVLMVTAFTIFVGAGAPVVRAAIMGILGLIALQAERVAIPRLTILWTAFFMLLWNPMQIWYDASFQLSFLAVIGITELGPWLKRVLKKVPETFAIRESLVATLAAQIGTLPISILIFRQFSLVSPIVNILVAPLVPLSMLVGSMSLLLSLLWMPLSLAIGYLIWSLLQAIIFIAHLGAMMPFASVRW